MMDPEIKAEWASRVRAQAALPKEQRKMAEWLLTCIYIECTGIHPMWPNRYQVKSIVSDKIEDWVEVSEYDQIHPDVAAWAGLERTEPYLPSYQVQGGTKLRGRNQTLYAIQRVGELEKVEVYVKGTKKTETRVKIAISHDGLAKLIEADL